MLIVTTDGLPGFEIRTVLGQVFGVAVLTDHGHAPAPGSPSSATFSRTGEQPAVGLAQTRREAVQRLGEEARRLGANAVLGMTFDNASIGTSTGQGGHEVCAYGTAVWAEQPQGRQQTPQSQHSQQMPPYGAEQQPGTPRMVGRNLTVGLDRDIPR